MKNIIKFLKDLFTKNEWENVFSGRVKSRSGDGKLLLQAELKKQKIRALACSNGMCFSIPMYKLLNTFPEAQKEYDRVLWRMVFLELANDKKTSKIASFRSR